MAQTITRPILRMEDIRTPDVSNGWQMPGLEWTVDHTRRPVIRGRRAAAASRGRRGGSHAASAITAVAAEPEDHVVVQVATHERGLLERTSRAWIMICKK